MEIAESVMLSEAWQLFETDEQKKDNRICLVAADPEFLYLHGVQHLEIRIDGNHVMISDGSVLCVKDNWKEAQFLSMGSVSGREELLIQLFYAHAVQRRMIQVHSSLIRYRENGILFLGPSGIGKTTQAELWRDFCGAEIINGDLVYVQERADKFLGWGTPWHGSSVYCMNTSVPLCALVVLKQASQNCIRRLEGFEKVTAVSRNIFYPLWVTEGTQLCVAVLNQMLLKLPVYELSCRAEESAVRLLEKRLADDP